MVSLSIDSLHMCLPPFHAPPSPAPPSPVPPATTNVQKSTLTEFRPVEAFCASRQLMQSFRPSFVTASAKHAMSILPFPPPGCSTFVYPHPVCLNTGTRTGPNSTIAGRTSWSSVTSTPCPAALPPPPDVMLKRTMRRWSNPFFMNAECYLL